MLVSRKGKKETTKKWGTCVEKGTLTNTPSMEVCSDPPRAAIVVVGGAMERSEEHWGGEGGEVLRPSWPHVDCW